jgi:hypothetical protein
MTYICPKFFLAEILRNSLYSMCKKRKVKLPHNRPCSPREVREVKALRLLDNGTVW